MTSTQYRAALDRLDLTQGEAAEFLGINIRTSSNYATGKPIPLAVAKLLRLMVRLKLKPNDI
jgi:hypothetical protein